MALCGTVLSGLTPVRFKDRRGFLETTELMELLGHRDSPERMVLMAWTAPKAHREKLDSGGLEL
jgi:hypothetical protein